jgi:F-type H+-transporting ATPase subunit gamma
MSRSREVEGRINLYRDLTDIVNAMRSFAFVELRRLARRAEAQARTLKTLETTLKDMAPAFPASPPPAADIWVLFGSVRGFCGSFNEEVVRYWREQGAPGPAVAVGERLWSLMPESASVTTVMGASGALDALIVIEAVLAALDRIWKAQPVDMGLMIVAASEIGVVARRLLPLAPSSGDSGPGLPITQENPATVARSVAQHYLFHALMAELVRSIQIENHTRLAQMENALSHLARGIDDMARRRNRLRQEEVIQEIELIVGARTRSPHNAQRMKATK